MKSFVEIRCIWYILQYRNNYKEINEKNLVAKA